MSPFSTYILLFWTLSTFGSIAADDATSDPEKIAENFDRQIEKLRKLYPPYAKIEEPQSFERDVYGKVVDKVKYDFIIVGAGASGAALAHNLAKVSQWKILLLEAGDAEDEITKVPSLSFNLLSSKYNWGYYTTPQEKWCLGSKERKCLLGLGKALGGSTAINGMLWARGNPEDYDLWAHQGNEGWSYKDVLPYFKKIEDSEIKHFSADYQGKGGRVHLENSRLESHVTEYVLRAAHELGVPYVNYNGKQQLGIGHAQGTLKGGKRWSSASAYLKNLEEQPNLFIKTRSTVLKVLIDEIKKEAYGVQYLHNQTLYEVQAKKEVILSAGGMASPKLLALSGIGPMETLERFGIQTLSNLKVGSTLRTHLAFPGIKVIFNDTALPLENKRQDIIDYLTKGQGPLTAFSSNLLAYFRTGLSENHGEYTDVELTFAPQRHKSPNGDKLALSMTVVLMHPKSLGSVKITSSDPLQPPMINPNYLTDTQDADLKTVLSGIRLAEQFLNTTIFKRHGGYLDKTSRPECRSLPFGSDAYWKCSVRHQSICLSDPASTAKMGPQTDKEAVVDNNLRVYGIKNLRVIDNSVIPVSISGHMMAPAYMIGEKGADILKYFWKEK